MFLYYCVILTTFVYSSSAEEAETLDDSKIVGGSSAQPDQFPYQVSLQLNNRHFCGGSIINERWILTAAHCLQSPNNIFPWTSAKTKNITVVVGTHKWKEGGDKYHALKTIVHDKYSSTMIRNDIGMIMTDKDIVYKNNTVGPVKLPSENFLKADYPAVLSGWGTTSYPGKVPDELQHLNLTVIDQKECLKANYRITHNNICTLNTEGSPSGACHGDSGGPLVADDEQIGIVSWGVPCAKGRPDVFTRVYCYSEWIQEQMKIKE